MKLDYTNKILISIVYYSPMNVLMKTAIIKMNIKIKKEKNYSNKISLIN